MSQILRLKAKGLYTSWSEFADLPEGSLLKADNVDIIKDNIVEPRRGFERQAAGYSTTTDRTDAIWYYKDVQFAHHGTYGSADEISYFQSGSWNSVGAFSAPTGSKVRAQTASQNLYFATSTGVQKLDAIGATATLAGTYKGLDVNGSTTGGSGFLAVGERVAYRIVWGYTDANDNLILGAPSQRADITNSSGVTRDISLTFSIPTGVTTSFIYQVYRSAAVTSSVEPNDELQLVYEGNPTAGEISAGTITITDITPDELRGATIYTASSQEGLVNQNERPPLCTDLASFRDSIFFANTTSKHRYQITMLSVGGSLGVQDNDTLTIDSVVYTGKTAGETIASGFFQVFTGGSASQNIDDTARSLVRVINRYASSTVYAYYLSGPGDLPGLILLEERNIGGSSFAINASRSSSWSPTDIPTSGTAETSSNDRFKNGLFFSKDLQPEAVPLPNFYQVGDKDSEILRIVPLKDALIIFKEDGIFRLTGYYPSFDIELLDSSARLIASGTPAILNNQIFCLTDQGVSIVSDSVRIISRPIEETLLSLFAADINLVASVSFGVGYEVERKYYLWVPSSASDTYPTQAFVYNVFTNTWVRHTIAATAAVTTNTQLYYGDPSSNFILKDRRSFTFTDYADFVEQLTITATNGNVITLNDVSRVEIGDLIRESATVFANVDSIDALNSTVTVTTNPGFTNTTVDHYAAIDTEIQWTPAAAGNPGITKQFHTTQLVFRKDFTGQGYMTYLSDLVPSQTDVTLEGSEIGAWGLFTWGGVPWGGDERKRPVRQWVPRDKQRCSQLTVGFKHAYAFSAWQMQGLALHFTPGTDRTNR